MNAGNVFFALCSLIALLGGIGTIAARNPIRGAVALLVAIIGIAGLFLQLNAEFLAAIQLIVYAGAVVVLFVFVIMLLGPDADPGAAAGPPRAKLSRWVAGIVFLLLAASTALLGASSATEPAPFVAANPGHGSVEAVGTMIFSRALVPFELTTALLIVAVVGAIAVARARHAGSRKVKQKQEPLRLFHGPVHPRDAGHPLPKESLP